jgi:hypothetical protein
MAYKVFFRAESEEMNTIDERARRIKMFNAIVQYAIKTKNVQYESKLSSDDSSTLFFLNELNLFALANRRGHLSLQPKRISLNKLFKLINSL